MYVQAQMASLTGTHDAAVAAAAADLAAAQQHLAQLTTRHEVRLDRLMHGCNKAELHVERRHLILVHPNFDCDRLTHLKMHGPLCTHLNLQNSNDGTAVAKAQSTLVISCSG